MHPVLTQLVILFFLSILVVLVCHRLRFPSIVGFLLTGLLCGPSALRLVTDKELVDVLSEVGVSLLLFTIGLELSSKELLRMSRALLVGGTAQVVLTMGLVVLLSCYFIGFANSLIYGCLIALSSTAIVLTILQQKAQGDSPHGRLCLAMLIFQDLAIVPMMLLFPLLSGGLKFSGNELLFALAKAAFVLGGILFFGKFLLPRLMLWVMRTRSRELLLMTTWWLCVSVADLTSHIGLSASLGAFLAGLMLAESEYSLSVTENILPFKDIFTSIFFISVGMLLDMNVVLVNLHWICLLVAGVLFIKIVAAIPAALAVGCSLRVSIIAALSMSQIGEFSFVLTGKASQWGFMSSQSVQIFLAAGIVTMMLTPVLISFAPSVASKVLRALHRQEEVEGMVEDDANALNDHVIIVGFGIGGKILARVSKKNGIPYVILEMNPDTVAAYRGKEPIYHGDASYPLVLEQLGCARARVLAILTSDPASMRAIVANARNLNPNLKIVVRSRFISEMTVLAKYGADNVIPEEFETSLEVFARVLNYYLVPRHTILHYIDKIRTENYSVIRENTVAPDHVLKDIPDLRR